MVGKTTRCFCAVNDFTKVGKRGHADNANLGAAIDQKMFSKENCEQLICMMVLEGVLAEFVQHNAYAATGSAGPTA